ncbi:hypothetical protein V5799_023812 [Amblyomma americanum]|uniref:Uncharacterized protein n=1 Tax=Amblyomma americanum TaxID=6943 RepID=A0AAQ4FGF8_AMBAM
MYDLIKLFFFPYLELSRTYGTRGSSGTAGRRVCQNRQPGDWLCGVYQSSDGPRVSLQQPSRVRCNESHMDLLFPLRVERPRIVYDVRHAIREWPLRGEVHISMDLIELDIGLLASKKKEQSRPLVTHLDISKLDGFGMTFHRMGVLGAMLNLAVETAHSVYGQPLEDFFEILLWRALQRYADNNPLPI